MFFMFLLSTFSLMAFMFNKHNLVLALSIISFTLTSAMFIYLQMKMSWMSYILFMLFLSGMMVVFAYVSSLASNDQVSNYFFSFYIYPLMILINLLLFFFYYMKPSVYFLQNNSNMYLNQEKLNMMMSMMYSNNNQTLILIMFLYLLLVLIISVKMIFLSKGPLNMNK